MSRRGEPATRAAREGEALVFTGPLVRDVVASLWPSALAGATGADRYDLRAVSRVDSAGLAMLVELAARCSPPLDLLGTPEGLQELRAAYRLDQVLRPTG